MLTDTLTGMENSGNDQQIEYQWGMRTVYSDGSDGIDWMNQDEAEAELAHSSEWDGAPGMRVRTRELVRRSIVAGPVEVVPSDYDKFRAEADARRTVRRAS